MKRFQTYSQKKQPFTEKWLAIRNDRREEHQHGRGSDHAM
jgi:hypothetical protein